MTICWTLMTNDIRWRGPLSLSTTRTQTVRCSFPFSSSVGCCCQWTGNDGWPKLNRIVVLSCPDLSNWWPIRNKCDSVLCEERTSSITCHKAAKDEEGRKSRWFIALRSGFQSCHTEEEVEKKGPISGIWCLPLPSWISHGYTDHHHHGDTRRGRGRVDWWPAGQCGALGTIHYKLLLLLDIIYCVDTINESDAYAAGQDSDWKWCRVLWCDVVDNALILTRPIGDEEWAGRDFPTIRSISSSLRLASLNGNPPSHHPLQTSFVVAGLGFSSCRRQLRDPWAVSTSSLNKICYGQYNKISDKMTMFHY